MKEIKNAFVNSLKNYNCFACSPDNKFGLQMKFFDDGENIVSIWTPKLHFDGWDGVIHGGIQATLIDEIGEWYVFTKIGRSAVTLNLDIRYKKPLNSGKGNITLKAKLSELNKNVATINISVYDGNNELCTTGTGKFHVFSEKESKEKFNFPGIEKFR